MKHRTNNKGLNKQSKEEPIMPGRSFFHSDNYWVHRSISTVRPHGCS